MHCSWKEKKKRKIRKFNVKEIRVQRDLEFCSSFICIKKKKTQLALEIKKRKKGSVFFSRLVGCPTTSLNGVSCCVKTRRPLSMYHTTTVERNI